MDTLQHMARRLSFTPYSVKLKSGARRWRVYVPDSETVHGEKKRRGGKTRQFIKKEEALAFCHSLKKANEIGVKDLARIDAKKSKLYDQFTYQAQEMGFENLADLMSKVSKKKILDPAGPTVGEILAHYRMVHEPRWKKKHQRTLSTFMTCTKPVEDLRDEKAAGLDHVFWAGRMKEIYESGLAASTVDRTFMFLRSAYKLQCGMHVLVNNPFDALKKQKAKTHVVRVIDPQDLRKFMDQCVTHHPDCVAFFALLFFCGVRPLEEASRLRWEHIHWKENEIEIIDPASLGDDDDSKTHRRFIRLEKNLKAWLKPLRKESGVIGPPMLTDHNRVSQDIVKKARTNIRKGKYTANKKPLFGWTRDIARHSYGSYWEAANRSESGSADLLRSFMGHKNLETYLNYYKNTRSPKQALLYWGITPKPAQVEALKKYAKSFSGY